MTIQEFIKSSGMTQKQLSERFRIPKRTIEEWSRGARKCPDYVVRMMDPADQIVVFAPWEGGFLRAVRAVWGSL